MILLFLFALDEIQEIRIIRVGSISLFSSTTLVQGLSLLRGWLQSRKTIFGHLGVKIDFPTADFVIYTLFL